MIEIPNKAFFFCPLTITTLFIGSEKSSLKDEMKAGNSSGNVIYLLFLLQSHYFSCKKPFDMKTLNSTYTQVSAKISQLWWWWWGAGGCTCLHFDRSFLINWGHAFVHRWRAKVSIRPWESWTCCLTTLRPIWLLNGTETSWLFEELLMP